MEQPIAKFSLQGIQIKQSTFRQSEAYGEDFKFDVEANGIASSANRTFQLHLHIRAYDNNDRFEARVHQVGNFVFDQDITEEALTNYFIFNAPALLFPFVRSYIATLTALSGYDTILLPALNLQGLGNMLRENISYE